MGASLLCFAFLIAACVILAAFALRMRHASRAAEKPPPLASKGETGAMYSFYGSFPYVHSMCEGHYSCEA